MSEQLIEKEALILKGDGYSISITDEAVAQRSVLLASASGITSVSNNDESADTQVVIKRFSRLCGLVEKSRKEVKEPVIRIGKLIDSTAAGFLAPVNAEETRLRALVGKHAEQVAAERAAAEQREREAFAAAERAKREAEEAAQRAVQTKNIGDLVAANEAHNAQQKALMEKLEASNETSATKVAQGVRFAIDFEVTDIERFYAEQPNLVDLTVRRADCLAWLKSLEQEMINVVDIGPAIGLRVFKKPVVSSR